MPGMQKQSPSNCRKRPELPIPEHLGSQVRKREYDDHVEVRMYFEKFSFGSICIDGVTYKHDVVIDRGQVGKRKKKPSKRFRAAFGHTPLSLKEKIPWKCRRLVIGTGTGALPVMKQVKQEATRRKIKLVVLPTVQAIKALTEDPDETNAILHVTC
jgi:hypothetical protein